MRVQTTDLLTILVPDSLWTQIFHFPSIGQEIEPDVKSLILVLVTEVKREIGDLRISFIKVFAES
jgi:hypothetical protein